MAIRYTGVGKPACRSILWTGMGGTYCQEQFANMIDSCKPGSDGKIGGGFFVRDCIQYTLEA
jgi:Ca2+-binding EF-hand superfamily protein